MGNMSNPCINRWGLNTMWYRHWYSDSSYSLMLGQDRVITDLCQIYLNYGTDHSARSFWNPFWYKKSSKPERNNPNHYYRWVPLYSEVLRTTSYYPFRLTSEERFNTRITVLRYNSWFIINMYWLQPDKVRQRKVRIAKLRQSTTSITLRRTSLSQLTKLNSLSKLAEYRF